MSVLVNFGEIYLAVNDSLREKGFERTLHAPPIAETSRKTVAEAIIGE